MFCEEFSKSAYTTASPGFEATSWLTADNFSTNMVGFVLANGILYSNQSGEVTFESTLGMKKSSLSQLATA